MIKIINADTDTGLLFTLMLKILDNRNDDMSNFYCSLH